MLTIENLNESKALDSAAASELRGGYMGAYFAAMSTTTNVFTQNATNLTVAAGDASLINLGSLTLTPVSAGSAMTWVQTPAVMPGVVAL